MRRKEQILIPVICAAAVILLLRIFFLFGYVPTESMEPTLEKGSYILASRLYVRLEVGDIIVFEKEGRLLIKRIAGVGGDMINHNGKLQQVPDGHFYMIGDNASVSYDSRFWSDPFISKTDVYAKLILPAS